MTTTNSLPASPSPPEHSANMPELLEQIRSGDRAAVAAFLNRYGEMIRRRVRGRLTTSMRRFYDSEEILSTVCRRLDRYVQQGRLNVTSEAELWSLVNSIADNSFIDKARTFRSIARLEQAVTRDSLSQGERLEGDGPSSPDIELARLSAGLNSDIDRTVLRLWLNNVDHVRIAEQIDSTPDAVRQRWRSIRDHLRAQIFSGAL